MKIRESYNLRVEKAIANREWEKFHKKFIRVLKKAGREIDCDILKDLESEIQECVEATTGKVFADLRLALHDLLYKKKNRAILIYWYVAAVMGNDFSLK